MSGTNATEAAAYYDSAEATAFYRLCWGGSDIHIGRYDTGLETVPEASVSMTRHLLALAGMRRGDRVLDIACGYGGTLRELARIGCRPCGIDISQRCVDEARRAIAHADLSEGIPIVVGDFHDIPHPDGAMDGAVCQESIIHSMDRPRVFAEVFRVLRPGGVFAFSDILTGTNADPDLVDAAFERLGVRGGATLRDYQSMAEAAGFELQHTEERANDIATHYAKLMEKLAQPPAGLSEGAAARLRASITRWQTALAGGHITWACFVALKPENSSPQ